jgi:protease I
MVISHLEKKVQMKKALILTWEKFQDHEVIYPYYSLKEHGFEVTVAANKVGKIFGILGCHMMSDMSCRALASRSSKEWDLLVIPGGVKALEKLRLEQGAIQFVQRWMAANKMVFVLCNGPQLLISAKVLRDRKITGYYAIEQDIINAGATYSRDEVVVDGNLVSCPHYDFMGEWLKVGYEQYENQ